MHAEDDEEDHYLILGGNGFIGFETVCCLLNKYADRPFRIILGNRGRSWDWDRKEILNARTKHLRSCTLQLIHVDRKQTLANCQELVRLVSSVGHFRAVIDFSAYKSFALKESLKLLGDKCKLYVFISTDSVYEVCVRKQHLSKSEEVDSVRPLSKKEKKSLKRFDRYGHHKLKCEEHLQYYGQCLSSLSYVILRLADVIGPRDSTHRLWQYILWVMVCSYHDVPVYLPESSRHQQLSLCYVKDVASFLADLCFAGDEDKLKMICKNDCYNLAAAETITIEQLLSIIHREFKLTGRLMIHYCDEADTARILPSVTRGPVDVTKAMTLIGWRPVSVLEAVKCSVEFYADVMSSCNFHQEKKECMKELLHDMKDLYPRQLVRGVFRNTLRKFLNI
jgi:nucleoside-diphosphate-sugar epimerase